VSGADAPRLFHRDVRGKRDRADRVVIGPLEHEQFLFRVEGLHGSAPAVQRIRVGAVDFTERAGDNGRVQFAESGARV
jgi:hypothetical protein